MRHARHIRDAHGRDPNFIDHGDAEIGRGVRDGVAVVLGLLTSGLALFVTAGLMLMAWVWGSEWVMRLVSI